MTPELAHAIEQAVWYPYNVLPQQEAETVHSWIVRAVIATVEPTLAEYERLLAEQVRAFADGLQPVAPQPSAEHDGQVPA